MHKIYKEYCKAQNGVNSGIEPLDDLMSQQDMQNNEASKKKERDLSIIEKKYLLATERGDIIKVKKYLDEAHVHCDFDKNAVDPLGRNALQIAIEYENLEMMEILLNSGVESGEAILHAINEEFVEAVELLLNYEDNGGTLPDSDIIQSDNTSNQGTSLNDQNSKSFTPDITPLILASHKDNYEIIKILLDRGAQVIEPHDVRCTCDECVKSRSGDSLRYSKSRINTYRALASPSLISLSSKDPILTAFQLSWELKRLSRIENEFKKDYEILSIQCQEYASALLNETRTSQELDIILNHDHENPPALFENETEQRSLSRLKLAVKYKQKKFVAHPHCQQLLSKLWYEDFTMYTRRNIAVKILIIFAIGITFPIISLLYLILPYSRVGRIIHQPFIKFVCQSFSYVLFLCLIISASLPIKSKGEYMHYKEQRGPLPTNIECFISLFVASFIWNEIKQLYNSGLYEYLNDWWNLLDFMTNTLYVTTIVLRFISYTIVQKEIENEDKSHAYNRDLWDPWDPTLISEGIFAIANVFSSLKLVGIFVMNPHVGPLQISLGRMIFDILKFCAIILLTMFSFACGLTQLFWYYVKMRQDHCKELEYKSDEELDECILKFNYFTNLFETLQTLYWGYFGYVEKDRIELLHYKHRFTIFVGLLMFGTYMLIMMVVLINMLIAMMNSSFQIITNQSDEEWKFAVSKSRLSYFDDGNTLPPPFNLVPSPKSLYYLCQWIYHKVFCLKASKRKQARWLSIRKVMKKISEREYKYHIVVKALVKRYIMRKQQRNLNAGVTEDDLNEIKQDIAGFRFELLEIFKNNSFKVDILKQSNTKRKRGKLNLEKAMSKNMFDDPKNQQIDIFENFKNIIPADMDLLKKSYQQSVINATMEHKAQKATQESQDQSVNEVQETKSKTNKVSIVEPQQEGQSVFKMALKIKRLTEEKFLKKTSSVDSKISTTNDSNQDLKSCMKKSTNEEVRLVLTEETNLLSDEVTDYDIDKKDAELKEDAPKASPEHTVEVDVDRRSSSELLADSEGYQERITEV